MNKLELVLLCIMALLVSANAQDGDLKKLKAREILTKAKSANTGNLNFESVTALSLNFKTTAKSTDDAEEQNSTETTDLYLTSDKIRSDTFGDYKTNTANTSLIVNGNLFERNFEVFVDGVKINAAFSVSTPKETEIKILKRHAWIMTFPIFFQSLLSPNIEFSYGGIAESKDDRANIIETTEFDRNYQFFFSEKTNLLLMMTETWKNKDNKEIQTKYFFSDYREESSLFFAHKIAMQSSDARIGTGETIIKSVKINPTFKPNFFDVKK